MPTVLVTGGTGLIGNSLCRKLREKGYDVTVLSREKKEITGIQTFFWDITKGEIDEDAIKYADYIIHLAGANIGDKRWTPKRKQIILESRIKSGQLLYTKVKEQNKKLSAFICASATGYYGALTSDKIFTEIAPPANDFLGETCNRWEQIADHFGNLGIRKVKIRTGLVLTRQGGALAKMINPVKFGAGAALGSGRQYIPWIHIDDLCYIYIKAIEDSTMEGAYNTVAPESITNKEFMRTLAGVLKKPFVLPNIPAFLLKIILGEMSDVVLKGSRVSTERLEAAGYIFKFKDLKKALENLLTKLK